MLEQCDHFETEGNRSHYPYPNQLHAYLALKSVDGTLPN